MNNDILVSPEQIALEQKKFITKVYSLMAGALAITGLVSMYAINSQAVLQFVFGNRAIFYGLLIAELLMVGSLVAFVARLSATVAMTIFILYSALNGLTLSGIFLIYTASSVAITFFITAGLFAVMSAYGYFTGKDLTKFGNLLMMLLIGLVLATIVNIFMNSTAVYWITAYLGVFIFTGLIAYDTQKLKNMYVVANEDEEAGKKVAIVGALSLYLDFINLFLMLLRFFGRRSN
ncbi:MAG: Bax inhibitor-1 family protein [Flavisolibacter sp.]